VKSLIKGLLSQKFAQFSYSVSPTPSYSQCGEDSQIQMFVQGVREIYWDIVFGHPMLGNKSYALYKDRWRGLLVWPIPELAKLSKKLSAKEIFIYINLCNQEIG
jgi:hypothetical protein